MDYVIIVAGGKGLRMGSDIPKQFLPIGGKPVLMRTLERFRAYSSDLQIILVLPEAQQDYWRQLCEEYHFDVEYQLANGGQTRFHSVQNGLALVPDDAEGVVGVHDGVRPFPSIEVIRNCYETAREEKSRHPRDSRRRDRTSSRKQGFCDGATQRLPSGADAADLRYTIAQGGQPSAL